MKSDAKTVKQYLDELPPERRKVLEPVRKVIRKHLPKGFVEEMQFGMIGYCVPLKTLPGTYNGKPLLFAALAAQKNFSALYLMWMSDRKGYAEFVKEFRAAGKKLDAGKACIRFQKPDDLPLEVVAKAIARCTQQEFIALYRKTHEA